jgi:hypothetical protein
LSVDLQTKDFETGISKLCQVVYKMKTLQRRAGKIEAASAKNQLILFSKYDFSMLESMYRAEDGIHHKNRDQNLNNNYFILFLEAV